MERFSGPGSKCATWAWISSTSSVSSVGLARRPSCQSDERACFTAMPERATPRTSQTVFNGRPSATRANAQSGFLNGPLNGFFLDFDFHRLLPEQSLQFLDFLDCGGQLRCRYNGFARLHCRQAAFLVLLAPAKHLVRIHAVPPRYGRHRCARRQRFLHDGDFFLGRASPTTPRLGQNFDEFHVMTRLTDRHKTIPYFKRVLVSSDTWGRSSGRNQRRHFSIERWRCVTSHFLISTIADAITKKQYFHEQA
ncbi:hypothetical protein LMG28688_05313 [Paraburkholderia caffeinitolerans]|uniref:Uncharacterized protein n=1 Tax=Paraburkholderia caffeinitolerans TaxID=1723730 RepID=A0A6J5GIG4_9BURK|nr:hypothetical protein LMG28688_05313 [Paraburkholderia caffeinitolerans]